MIAYRINQADLEALIESEAPGWLRRAAARTAEFRQLGRYEEQSSIWSEVKSIYMRLQGNCKCAYCERKLESIDLGKGEQDVEHFRPKGRVRAWRLPKWLKEERVIVSQAPDQEHGDFDTNPEDLIRFHGVSPCPVAAKGHNRARALVTIEFFKLDDEAKRKNLLRERAIIIIALHPHLEKLADGAAGTAKTDAEMLIRGFTSPSAPHTGCARSYKELFDSDRDSARAIFDRALNLITSLS